jgi:hypothetical protein
MQIKESKYIIFGTHQSVSIVLNNMVFPDFKDSIKACDSDNLMIKDSFSCLTFLRSLLEFLEFLEFLLNLRKSSKRSLSEFSSDN